MHNWIVYLLPYLDETMLYRSYNFREPHDSRANTTVPLNTGLLLSSSQWATLTCN